MDSTFICIGHGASGYFAQLADQGGPIQTGLGRYASLTGAIREALDWSVSDGVPLSEETDLKATELGLKAGGSARPRPGLR